MTDKSPPCPRCGCTVSDAASYYFVPADNLRWHARCWDNDKINRLEREKLTDQPEETQ